MSACGSVETSEPTPPLRPTRIVQSTPTPNAEAIAKGRVASLFAVQVAAIQQNDWPAVYRTCSPEFRSARALSRYIQDAPRQFALDGYSPAGFEARNVEPFVRAPDRIRVRWDAYQDGNFVRATEIGQTYIFTQGAWFDDGAWCR